MVAPVRPPVWPVAPSPIAPGRADARMTAQKAFFQAALAGKPVAAAPVSVAPAGPTSRGGAEAPAVDRIPRPGSIVDILV
jgi:hypothetical protein